MKKKLLLFILIFVLTPHIASCAKTAKKDTAYCFSAVFDAKDNEINITLYCRVPDKASAESSNDTEKALTLTGKSIPEAFNSSKNSEYEIYYNSISALYFTEKLTRDTLLDASSELYNKTKYQTATMVYSPKSGASQTTDEIHSSAKEICKEKGIKESDKNNYVNFTKFIRNNTAQKG